ncbi:nuclear transport factor 2 family protein [Aldersonia sp. NBC_00410]|uniref:nuclear transport factor 2 family protein n=1 Tax=Aldersonia sp. NBC_00410 TaxID=2975954 RepID=UPI00224CA6E0|nr:nuclear transport factor 2 family protein [Aldersonia sp. NBC_00410]MCX5042953.1 nuclear transport factor 2 family protein [Aldersonia sp. NBC_00410]
MPARLTDMIDRAELTSLVHSVGRNLDQKAFEGMRAIYTADAEAITPGGTAHGIEAVIAQVRRNHQDYEASQHLFGDVQVDVDGDTAVIGANTVVTLVPEAEHRHIHRTIGVRYRFDGIRTSEGWRLRRVGITPVWERSTISA